jgi:hypothetical protein
LNKVTGATAAARAARLAVKLAISPDTGRAHLMSTSTTIVRPVDDTSRAAAWLQWCKAKFTDTYYECTKKMKQTWKKGDWLCHLRPVWDDFPYAIEHVLKKNGMYTFGLANRILFLPPSSPFLSPIEFGWSFVKRYSRSNRTISLKIICRKKGGVKAEHIITAPNTASLYDLVAYKVNYGDILHVNPIPMNYDDMVKTVVPAALRYVTPHLAGKSFAHCFKMSVAYWASHAEEEQEYYLQQAWVDAEVRAGREQEIDIFARLARNWDDDATFGIDDGAAVTSGDDQDGKEKQYIDSGTDEERDDDVTPGVRRKF